jgi:hypothetical protein
MKKYIFLIILPALLFSSCKKESSSNDLGSVSMGTNSATDVYYSFANGEAGTVANTDWDIAFSVPLMTASVIINEGSGTELYCVGDTNAWNNVNASTISGLEQRYNDKSNWMAGAFNHNISDPMNFGWGTYNISQHLVKGDSIFIIKLGTGILKKLFIRGKSSQGVFTLRWADIDGSNQVDMNVPTATDTTRHFIHFSLSQQQIVAAEPEKDKWDLLFTNYITLVPTGPASFMNYSVMGILANPDVKLIKVTGIAPETSKLSDANNDFSSQADLIGWDWKVYDQPANTYSIAPNTSYFAKLKNGKIYKIYFTEYGGHEAGTVSFKTELVE